MSNKIKCDTARIKSFREEIAVATKESENCESALAEAKLADESTAKDDGKTSPEVLYERHEASRKNVFLRKTEAKRASENLEKLETEFEGMIRMGAGAIIPALQSKLEEVGASLREQLSPLVARGDSHAKNSVEVFIRSCDEFAERQRLLGAIRNHQEYYTNHGGTVYNLACQIEMALKLL